MVVAVAVMLAVAVPLGVDELAADRELMEPVPVEPDDWEPMPELEPLEVCEPVWLLVVLPVLDALLEDVPVALTVTLLDMLPVGLPEELRVPAVRAESVGELLDDGIPVANEV